MKENEFWVKIWALVACGIIVTSLATEAGDAYSNYTMLQMVAKGADPIKARCAVYGSRASNESICVLAVQGH